MKADRKAVSLDYLLSRKSEFHHVPLTYHQSLPLAVLIASSLLQLNETAWLTHNRSAGSNFVTSPLDHQYTVDVSAPYVTSKIGESRKTYRTLVPTGHHPDLISLGIVLIELSENKSIFRWYEERFGTSLPDNMLANVEAAWQWFEEEVSWGMEWNQYYCKAIKLCLIAHFLGHFTPQRMTFTDDGFREAVYRQILLRLQKASDEFFGHAVK